MCVAYRLVCRWARQPARRPPGRRSCASARELFAQRGYAAVGTEEIVARAGVTRGALYHHFEDKRDLFRAVHEGLEAELVASIGARVEGIEDPWELLVTGIRGFLDACSDDALRQISLLDAPAVLGWEEWREISARHSAGLVSFGLENAMERGVLRRQEVAPARSAAAGRDGRGRDDHRECGRPGAGAP